MKRVLLCGLILSMAFSGPALARKRPKKVKRPPAVVEAPQAPAPPGDPEAWRAQPPKPGPVPDWTPPAAQVLTLSNGIPVYYAENPSLPLVTIALVMGVGREANPTGDAGLAALTANLLDEGTRSLTAEEIAAQAELLGADLWSVAGDETSVVSLNALTGETLAPTLDLYADVILRPAFEKKVFKRVQSETLGVLADARSDPGDVARRTFLRQIWGENHPYSRPAIGDEASIQGLKVGDVRRFYGKWWHAGNAAFVVSGALKAEEVKSMLDARFGAWQGGGASRVAVPAPSVPLQTRVLFVEQPGSVQSMVRIGTPAMARSAPEFAAAETAGTLVGGMFSSPLNMNLREEHGWSYGAYGAFSSSRDFGMFVANASVQADKTAPAVVEMLKELGRAAATPPTIEALTVARDYQLKALPSDFETNADVVNQFAMIPRYGLKPDGWQTYVRNVTSLTPTRVGELAQQYLDPRHMLVVVVGPRAAEGEDGKGGKTTVDVPASLRTLGYEVVEVPPSE